MVTDNLIFRKVLREVDSGIGAELYLYKNNKDKYYMMFLDNLLSKGKKSKFLLKKDLESGIFLEQLMKLLFHNDEFAAQGFKIFDEIKELINKDIYLLKLLSLTILTIRVILLILVILLR